MLNTIPCTFNIWWPTKIFEYMMQVFFFMLHLAYNTWTLYTVVKCRMSDFPCFVNSLTCRNNRVISLLTQDILVQKRTPNVSFVVSFLCIQILFLMVWSCYKYRYHLGNASNHDKDMAKLKYFKTRLIYDIENICSVK